MILSGSLLLQLPIMLADMSRGNRSDALFIRVKNITAASPRGRPLKDDITVTAVTVAAC